MILAVDARELQGAVTGTGRYLRNLLRHFVREEDVRVVAYFSGSAPADPILDHPRIACRELPAGRGLLWLHHTLPRALASDPADVLFAPAYVCPVRTAVPCVTTVHDLSFFALPGDFAFLDAWRRRIQVAASVRRSAAVLAVSEFTGREIAARLPDAVARVHVVPHGADDDLPQAPSRADARARLGIGGGPLLLTVGSLFRRRRVPELLTAFAALHRNFTDSMLAVVGEDRADPKLDVPARAARLGFRDRVRCHGYVSEAALADLYAAADVAVFLSDYEGFGLPALEALARGIPTVIADRPALNELFTPIARAVDPTDPAAIAAAIALLLRNPELRVQVAAAGRAFAQRFSWREASNRTLAVLRSVARR